MKTSSFLLLLPLAIGCLMTSYAGNFYQDVNVAWGDGRGKILNDQLLTLSLDKYSGSGFESRNEFLYGKVDMDIKLIPGNSAGIVTTFYLKAKGENWDEIDFEFLGNSSGHPCTLHTNVFSQGNGNKEQQFHLWFDPSADFHKYTILWNPKSIIFFIDGTPIREFKNMESIGIPYLKDQPMRMYSTLWNAEHWATRGGLVKTDWSLAPFTASYRNFNAANTCVWSNGASSCSSTNKNAWYSQQLDSRSLRRMKWVQKKYMVYDYCNDAKRFPKGIPKECNLSKKKRH